MFSLSDSPLAAPFLHSSCARSVVFLQPSLTTFDLPNQYALFHYQKPKQAEQYCYAKVLLRFFNTESIEWQAKKLLGFVDGTGGLDYRNIDRFVGDDGAYGLSGDWGRL